MWSNLLAWYKTNQTTIDIIDLFFKLIFTLVIFIFGFIIDKTYYEDIILEFFPYDNQSIKYNNIVDEISVGNSPDKTVLISSINIPITIEILEYDNINTNEQYKSIGKIKELEPGDVYKISYVESEGIPNYKLKVSTTYGEATIPLKYNGRYGNINKTKIKSTRKFIPYIFSKIFD